jgi:hypothetical protein
MPKRKASRAKSSKSSAKAKKKPAAKGKSRKSASAKTSRRGKRPAARRAPRRARRSRLRPGVAGNVSEITVPTRAGFGPTAGGQSGDIEDLPDTATVDSESVEELAAEGQNFEAEIVDAVEGAPDPDESEVKTREVPENDVPGEYEDDEKPGRFTR